MNIKEQLLKFKEKISVEISSKMLENSIELSDKIECFLDWYYENVAREGCSDSEAKGEVESIKKFIEKMAVWYELRYPEHEVNKALNCRDVGRSVDDVMFRNNSYINDLFDEKSDVRNLDWTLFYNTRAFIQSLSYDERYYLSKPVYDDSVYLSKSSLIPHVHLTKNGIVSMAENISFWIGPQDIKNEDLDGLHVKEVVKLFESKGVELSQYDNLRLAVKRFENWKYQKEEMLNCVMYRIIERGGNRIGPRRAFLFAKEFNRNIDIPMKYGYDFSDPYLREFINEYIKAGGSMDLECFDNYFRKNKKIETESIRNILLREKKYTSEEKELYQKLVDVLANQVDYNFVNQEKVKRLRIERKISKD